MTGASARPRARKRRIDRADIIRAACEILDEEGVAALSMARLGERLGVTAMALYRHIADRRDLEIAVVEHVLADLELAASTDGWRRGVSDWMHEVRAHWLRHPWLGRLIGTEHELAPPWLATLDQLAVVLDSAGLERTLVAQELVRISRTTAGIVLLEIAAPLPHTVTADDAARAGLDPDAAARWHELSGPLARYSNDELFDDLVTATLARIENVRVNRS
jgi:AcrR family transcriptional regulator